MEKFIQNCLLIADAAGHTSMAIPPLGTGALSTPITTAVSILLDEISQFSKSNPSSSLNDITLVIYEKDLDKYEASHLCLLSMLHHVMFFVPGPRPV